MFASLETPELRRAADAVRRAGQDAESAEQDADLDSDEQLRQQALRHRAEEARCALDLEELRGALLPAERALGSLDMSASGSDSDSDAGDSHSISPGM